MVVVEIVGLSEWGDLVPTKFESLWLFTIVSMIHYYSTNTLHLEKVQLLGRFLKYY